MTNNDKLVNFKAPEESVEQAKSGLEHGELSKELRATIDRLAHGADVAEETRLTDRLRTLREEQRDLRTERDNIESKIDEKSREIERVEQRLDALRDQQGEYDGVLAMLEEDLNNGVRILGGSDKIKRAAKLGDCEVNDVVADLKERNPDVPIEAFTQADAQEPANWKEAVDDGETLL